MGLRCNFILGASLTIGSLCGVKVLYPAHVIKLGDQLRTNAKIKTLGGWGRQFHRQFNEIKEIILLPSHLGQIIDSHFLIYTLQGRCIQV